MNTTYSIEQAFSDTSIGGNPFAITEIGAFISNVLVIIMTIAAIATLLYLLWGGVEWITSGGDKAGTERARSKITDAIIGFFIVFAAWAIFGLLQFFFGFSITGGGTSGGTGAKNCGPQQTAWVQKYAPQCVSATSTDWLGCWKPFIEKNPCLNFNDGTGSYWPRAGCTTPANICP